MNRNNDQLEDIGIVCMDNTNLSPVAAYILRDLAVRSKNAKIRQLRFHDAGYKRTTNRVSNAAKGFLQQRGFGTTDMMETKRVRKRWLEKMDLILVMDKFLKRDILYDFFSTRVEEMKQKIHIFNEFAGINERIRDPGMDYTEDITPVFLLVERCCQNIMKKLEKILS